MTMFKSGDVLSYSAATSNTGPDGYRIIRPGASLLEAVVGRWPGIMKMFASGVPLLVNMYPASMGKFDFGVTVDTYLSHKTGSRALQLAASKNMTAVIVGQPCFLLDFLIFHQRQEFPFPKKMVLAVGGYPMPASLEREVRKLTDAHCDATEIVQFYGVAEVDSAMLVGRDRTESGELIFHKRGADIQVEIKENGDLYMARLDSDGNPLTDTFRTGDGVETHGSDGYVLRNEGRRLDRSIMDNMETWTSEEWTRRTGYVGRRNNGALVFQTRDWVDELQGEQEVNFHDFAREFEHSWLMKPKWIYMGHEQEEKKRE